MTDPTQPLFWRDVHMPHVELRKIVDGRKLRYAPHSHVQWSLGAIIEGQCRFFYREDQFQVGAGSLVMMNPDWVHACNPVKDQTWSYWMLYVDTDWLTRLRYEIGLLEQPCWQDIPTAVIADPGLYSGYAGMVASLVNPDQAMAEKQQLLVDYLTALMHWLAVQPAASVSDKPESMQAVADFLRRHATEAISLQYLCECTGYSPGHLIRAFKHYSGFTPHEYLVNCRIQLGQIELKQGKAIAEAALNAGFSDQPHFQRTFKKLVAATPHQYRQSLLNQQV